MKLELDIHDDILKDDGLTEFDLKMIIGTALYNNNVTSTGKTAEILGISRRTFLDEMGKYGGILFDMDIDDFIKECEVVHEFSK